MCKPEQRCWEDTSNLKNALFGQNIIMYHHWCAQGYAFNINFHLQTFEVCAQNSLTKDMHFKAAACEIWVKTNMQENFLARVEPVTYGKRAQIHGLTSDLL